MGVKTHSQRKERPFLCFGKVCWLRLLPLAIAAAGCCRLLTPTYPLLNERLFWLQGSKPSTFGRQYTEEPVEITGKSRLSTPKTLKNTPTCPTAWCKASSRFIQGYFLLVLQRESQPGEARELWTPMGKITDEQLKLVQTQSPYSPEQVGATLNTGRRGLEYIFFFFTLQPLSISSKATQRARSPRVRVDTQTDGVIAANQNREALPRPIVQKLVRWLKTCPWPRG